MNEKRIGFTVVIAASLLLTGLGGCPQPSQDSVLEGTWEVVPDHGFDGPLAKLMITFNQSDQVSDVSYTFTSGVTVSWHDPDAATNVDGDTIHVSCIVGQNEVTFDGTLNSTTAPTSADGTINLNLSMGNLSVSVPQGSATLVKQ